MKKLFKYIIITIITLVILAAAGLTALVTLVNPNKFKPMIIKTVDSATGRQLHLDGDISWTIYPTLGIKVEKVSLSNPKGFPSSEFLKLNSANIAVSLIPLLENKIIFKELKFDGLNITLLKKGNINNWTFTHKDANNDKKDTITKKTDDPIKLTLSKFSITNSSVTYTDLSKNKSTAIKNINFSLDSGFGGGIKLNTQSNMLTLHKVKLNYNNQVVGDIEMKVINLNDPKYSGWFNFDTLKINELLNQFTNSKSSSNLPLLNNITLKANINGDMNNAKLSSISFNANKVLAGVMNLNINNFSKPKFTGNIQISKMNINKIMQQVTGKQPDIANKNLLNRASFKSNLSGSSSALNITNMVFKVGGTTLTGNTNINSFSPIKLNENLNINHFDIANISDINGFKAPLNKINIVGNANLGSNGINTLSGKQTITIGNITLIGFDLNQQIHRINNILVKSSKTAGNNILSHAANAAQINDDINKIRNSINSAIKPGPKNPKIRSNLGSFKLQAKLKNGVASPSQFNLTGPDLKLKGNGSINMPAKRLNYRLDGKITTKKIDPLFKNLTVGANISGTFKDPQTALDWNSLIQQLVRYTLQNSGNAIQKEVNKRIQKTINKNVPKALGNALKGLFN